jgi:hypothetical protein
MKKRELSQPVYSTKIEGTDILVPMPTARDWPSMSIGPIQKAGSGLLLLLFTISSYKVLK